ncbi:MAG: right-handed parallel beta-helix repeat-containing protein, partial [Nanoarchaeota archaeon]|nr:right-handed parallel beta-helix repeat-containing protein [Nanoarchaeota archaeon]
KGGNNFVVKNNVFDDNEIGLLIEGVRENEVGEEGKESEEIDLSESDGKEISSSSGYVNNVIIEGNTVTNTWMTAALKCHRCSDVTVKNNYLENNGKPEYFEEQRIVGIDLHETYNSRIFGNTVIESTSDGIGVPGEVWENEIVYSYNIKIFNNTVMDNGEQGIWAIGGRNITISNNKIISTKHCYTGCSGVFFEWNVSSSKIYNNEISGRGNEHKGITITNSHSNEIINNSITNIGFGIYVESKEGGQVIGDYDAVLQSVDPVNNVIISNVIDAWEEFIVLDNENNVVEDNVNLGEGGKFWLYVVVFIIIIGLIVGVVVLFRELGK